MNERRGRRRALGPLSLTAQVGVEHGRGQWRAPLSPKAALATAPLRGGWPSEGASPEPSPAAKPETPRRLHQPSPGGRTLTWSPGTRWAAAKSLEESPPWRGWLKTPEVIATSGVDSPGPRGCCKTLPVPAVQLQRCQNRGDLRQGGGKTPGPHPHLQGRESRA